jgi:hypothetical protein
MKEKSKCIKVNILKISSGDYCIHNSDERWT